MVKLHTVGEVNKNSIMKYPTEITEENKKVVRECATLLQSIAESQGQPYDFICLVGGVKSRLVILLDKLEKQ